MLGRNREAISLATENLCFSRQAYGEDSLEVIKSYSRLGLYCMSETSWRLSLWLLSKGLHLMLLCFGENYPEVLINFANIARVLSHMGGESPKAVQCYLKAISILTKLYGGKLHINVSLCYSSLAAIHYEMGEFRRAIEYQSESVHILQKVMVERSRCFQARTRAARTPRRYSRAIRTPSINPKTRAGVFQPVKKNDVSQCPVLGDIMWEWIIGLLAYL